MKKTLLRERDLNFNRFNRERKYNKTYLVDDKIAFMANDDNGFDDEFVFAYFDDPGSDIYNKYIYPYTWTLKDIKGSAKLLTTSECDKPKYLSKHLRNCGINLSDLRPKYFMVTKSDDNLYELREISKSSKENIIELKDYWDIVK